MTASPINVPMTYLDGSIASPIWEYGISRSVQMVR